MFATEQNLSHLHLIAFAIGDGPCWKFILIVSLGTQYFWIVPEGC